MVYPVFPAVGDIRGSQPRQTLQPQAGCLGFAVPKHPRLDYLVRLADHAGNNTDGIFNTDPWNVRFHQQFNEIKSLFLLLFLFVKPASSTDREVGAWRVGNHQVPPVIQDVSHVSLIVLPRRFAWEEVARCCILSHLCKSVSYHTTKFTRYQYSHIPSVAQMCHFVQGVRTFVRVILG